MNSHQEYDPFRPPDAEVDSDPHRMHISLGKFWGFIFALPVVLLWIASEVRQIHLVKWGYRAPIDIVISSVAFAIPAFVILWSGQIWSGRFRVARWPIRSLISLLIGGLCLFAFMAAVEIGWRITESVWTSFHWSDIVPTLFVWLVVSAYVAVEGIVIRSRIQKPSPS